MAQSFTALFFVILMPYFSGSNLNQGLYWLIFPHLCIVVNDVFSYQVGSLIGRSKLIDLSPKKTWEGFIGGAIFTLVICSWVRNLFLQIFRRIYNILGWEILTRLPSDYGPS